MKKSRRKFLRESVAATAGLTSGLAAAGAPALPGVEFTKPDRVSHQPPAPLKVCIFSKQMHWLDYPQLAATAAELGFDGVDLTVRPDGHVLPERVAADLPKAVDAVRKAGLEVYLLTTALSDAAQPHAETILKTAAGLGIPGYRTGWLDYRPDLDVPANLDGFRRKLAGLAALNKKYGIRGEYQNHAGTHLGAALWDLWAVLKDLDPQWIGCQYDIRHAVVEGANSWPLGLQLLRPYIRSLDVKDFRWADKNGKSAVENVPLGAGTVDFAKYLGLVKAYGLPGPCSLHLEYPLGGAENGAKTLSVPREQVLTAMRQDLHTLRGWLTEAGLG
jgi:sugar phosphate isomerase/epimerase